MTSIPSWSPSARPCSPSRPCLQQVAQLQKAQAVAVTRVTPLRVNLPTRGLRHSFVQVLQTEVDKPLTVQLSAHNDRNTGWFMQSLWWIGGLLLLWGLAAVALLFRPEPEKVRTAL